MTELLRVDQISPNEVVVSTPLEIAFDHSIGVMNRLGKVKKSERAAQFIEGRVKYGFQSVKVRLSFVEREAGTTNVVIQASSDDVWGVAARNATARFTETLRNVDNPGYQPDRLGVNPGALFGILMGFIILLLTLSYFLLPKILFFFSLYF